MIAVSEMTWSVCRNSTTFVGVKARGIIGAAVATWVLYCLLLSLLFL